jgi:hypothetical protein
LENNIFEKVTAMTGLPVELVQRDLKKYLDRFNLSQDNLTMEDLRKVMALYLADTVDATLEH